MSTLWKSSRRTNRIERRLGWRTRRHTRRELHQFRFLQDVQEGFVATHPHGRWAPVSAQSNGLFFQSHNFSFTELACGKACQFIELQCVEVHSKQWPAKANRRRNPSADVAPDHRRAARTWTAVEEAGRLVCVPRRAVLPALQFGRLWLLLQLHQGKGQQLALNAVVGRNSVSDPIFPVWGSNVMSVKATPPQFFRPDGFYKERGRCRSTTKRASVGWNTTSEGQG